MMTEIMPGMFCFRDTCNVYILRDGSEAIAIDFGSGRWLPALPRLGIRELAHVFLTHHHADQCAGLEKRVSWRFPIHAPIGEDAFLTRQGVKAYWEGRSQNRGCPPSYSALERGLEGLHFDMNGFGNLFWGNRRIRFIHTPGHGPNALSILVTHQGKEIVFCGDAAHQGGTIWQPYHLEWDHWTGAGTLAAWEGVQRLMNLGMDALCPSHGPVIDNRPHESLRRLAERLMDFYQAKGHICRGERDYYIDPGFLECGARRILPHLFQFGQNSYLLLSDSGEALVVDPWTEDLHQMDALWKELGRPGITIAVATHYHSDHSDGLPLIKKKYGAKIVLHPWVAVPLRKLERLEYPWLPPASIEADHSWPQCGTWRWNEYQFQIAPFPGQTWWHCAFMTRVDGQRLLFGGDNFQPASRWNGTGGFCAFNGSRFQGFVYSARLVLRWRPDIIATGHQTYYHFRSSQFRKIISWAARAEAATKSLCPSGDLQKDYYLHHPQKKCSLNDARR
jgi:glyoxylase-like metal-dependent hydrolase (beta-lactamase superfamily II)